VAAALGERDRGDQPAGEDAAAERALGERVGRRAAVDGDWGRPRGERRGGGRECADDARREECVTKTHATPTRPGDEGRAGASAGDRPGGPVRKSDAEPTDARRPCVRPRSGPSLRHCALPPSFAGTAIASPYSTPDSRTGP